MACVCGASPVKIINQAAAAAAGVRVRERRDQNPKTTPAMAHWREIKQTTVARYRGLWRVNASHTHTHTKHEIHSQHRRAHTHIYARTHAHTHNLYITHTSTHIYTHTRAVMAVVVW